MQFHSHTSNTLKCSIATCDELLLIVQGIMFPLSVKVLLDSESVKTTYFLTGDSYQRLRKVP